MRSMWTRLEKALLLKLIREHDMATSESCEWQKSTRTKCVRVVKSKMPMCERPRASDSRHADSLRGLHKPNWRCENRLGLLEVDTHEVP